ncbi:MAG: Ig-like domain-containing protein, partial [Clostridia bacterium]|nr:Ig-like domain-containing protein [Clostridia bacterium]
MKTRSKILTSLLCAAFCVLCLTFAATSFNGFTALADETPALTVTMAGTASVRKVDPVGIRFETTYSGDFSSGAFDGYSFGTLVIPTDLLNGELTKETAKAIDIEQLAWASQSDNSRVFYAVLANIPENASAYARDLTARSYYRTDEGEYVYSSTTVERSIAKVASLAINDGDSTELLQTFVKAVATGVSLSESQAEMVVGGKYTLSATTAPSGYGVYWRSGDEDIATVDKNGKVTAVSVGTTTITAEFGDYSASATVTVKNHIEKDGSEIIFGRQNNAEYSKVPDGTVIGTRENVYKFVDTDTNDGWTDRIQLYESSHRVGADKTAENGLDYQYATSAEAYEGMKAKNYNFVTFDFYLASGSLKIASVKSDGTNATNTYTTSSITNNNPNIGLYYRGEEITDKIATRRWYTVIVDRKNTVNPGSNWSAIDFAGTNATVYFDNIRYYYDESCYTDFVGYAQKDGYMEYDGSELVWGNHGNAASTYKIVDGEYGRENVYQLSIAKDDWKDKLMVYESGHSIGSNDVNEDKVVPYLNASTAFSNLTSRGYNYIAFDVCFTSGSKIRVNAPDYTGTSDKRNDYVAGGVISSQTHTNKNVRLYDENGMIIAELIDDEHKVTSSGEIRYNGIEVGENQVVTKG